MTGRIPAGTISLLLVFLLCSGLTASPRKLRIEGLRIFSEEEVIRGAGIDTAGSLETVSTTGAIEIFFRQNRYTLVKIHILKDTPDELVIFIDEGRLGKIVVHEKNNYYALKIKQAINIPERIYNTEVIDNNIDYLKQQFGFTNVRVELKKIPDYNDNIIQIDRELGRIEIMEQRINIFSRYPAEYELHFYFETEEIKRGFKMKSNGFGFNIDYEFPSVFIPVVSYYRAGLFMEKDFSETEVSAGFDPGLDGYLDYPPENTLTFPPQRSFFNAESEYRFMPIAESIFTPVIRGRFYHSYSGRKDLGLDKYEYIKIRATVAPGITPLEDLNFYAGLGCESVNIYDVRIDEDAAAHADVTEEWRNYPYIEARMIFDPIPFRIGSRKEKNFSLTYTHYLSRSQFREFEVKGTHDIEFGNLSILSMKFRGVLNSDSVPFHHQAQVNSRYFKGFPGLGCYSNRLAAISAEYRFSVYQDYLYTGFFCDWTCFEAEGLVLSGLRNGLAAGPTARLLIYDQYEVTAYCIRDWMFPGGSGQWSFTMKLTRKW